MTVIGAAFGAGLAVTLGFALLSRERWLSTGAWATLTFGWSVTILIAPYGERLVWIWPIFDAVFGTVAIAAAYRFRLIWPAILAMLFLGQCLVHVGWHYLQTYGSPDPARVYRYYRAINVLLIAQMVTVAGPGIGRVGAILIDRLRRFPWPRGRKAVARN